MKRRTEDRGQRTVRPLQLEVVLVNGPLAPSSNRTVIHSIAEPLLRQRRLIGRWLLEVRFVHQLAMRRLNRQAQGYDEPTDVLSFPIHFATNAPDPHQLLPTEGPQLLGSIVIAPKIAAKQATEYGRTTDQEIAWLIDHGVHHLLGHDHNNQGQWR